MMGTLRTLTLDKNQLSTLPYNFAELYELESLSIARNKLRNVSRCMCAATNVQNAPVLYPSLSLVHSRYYSLSLSHYSSLSLTTPLSLSLALSPSISLFSSQLPPMIHKMSSLRMLDVRGNGILLLPGSIQQCARLMTINISSNALTTLPPLPSSLVTLDASYNKITRINVSHLLYIIYPFFLFD